MSPLSSKLQSSRSPFLRVTLMYFCVVLASNLFSPAYVPASTVGADSHALELLGADDSVEIRKALKNETGLEKFVQKTTTRLLSRRYKKLSKNISSAILKHSKRHGFDPLFVMAVIQNESSFRPRMKGSVGEIGLMQVRPSTAKWIAKLSRISYRSSEDLYSPDKNIEIGLALMSKLRSQFKSHSRLYVSAYNIGARKVRKMVAKKNSPKLYVIRVMKRYIALHDALQTKGTPQERSELAFNNIVDITNKL